MTLWNAEGLKPIGYLVWPLRRLKVRNPFLTLTWPGDLTFRNLGLKFLHNVSNSIVSRYCKNGGAAHRCFSAIREKPEGWAFFAPPPVRVLSLGTYSQTVRDVPLYHPPVLHDEGELHSWFRYLFDFANMTWPRDNATKSSRYAHYWYSWPYYVNCSSNRQSLSAAVARQRKRILGGVTWRKSDPI